MYVSIVNIFTFNTFNLIGEMYIILDSYVQNIL